MQPLSKVLLLIASLLLVFTFFFPIWKIDLIAPQYPEGLSMFIWLHKITGAGEFDLQNINILNHYIGMRPIDPAEVKELEIIPFITAFIILFGIIAAWAGKKWLFLTWFVSFLIASTAGFVDFYLWKYEYGTNLDPTAPIIVPGMTYVPPLIGNAQLLNIKAASWPALGTYFALTSALIGIFVIYIEFVRKKIVNQIK